jgi:hypothetical protein
MDKKIRFTCAKDYDFYRMLLNQEIDDNMTVAHPFQHGQFPEKSTVRCLEKRKENGKKTFRVKYTCMYSSKLSGKL